MMKNTNLLPMMTYLILLSIRKKIEVSIITKKKSTKKNKNFGSHNECILEEERMFIQSY
jgi:hypothetical protein